MDIEIKEKYQHLKKQLYEIRNKIEDLDNEYYDLEIALKNNISINNEVPMRRELNDLRKEHLNISNEIVQELIPLINVKI